jgi:hypothetical protein
MVSMIVIRKNQLTMFPAEIVKILTNPLREDDGFGSLNQCFLFWLRGSAGNNDIDICIDTRMKR